MTAWAKLLAASSLTSGTAWQLISNPNEGGAGDIVNDGLTVVLPGSPIEAQVSTAALEVQLVAPIVVELAEPVTAVPIDPLAINL